MWECGQGYPNKHHKHFKVIFSITREEIELPVTISDKSLNLTRPTGYTNILTHTSSYTPAHTQLISTHILTHSHILHVVPGNLGGNTLMKTAMFLRWFFSFIYWAWYWCLMQYLTSLGATTVVSDDMAELGKLAAAGSRWVVWWSWSLSYMFYVGSKIFTW